MKLLLNAVMVALSLGHSALFGQTAYQVHSTSILAISGASTLSDWVVTSNTVKGEMTFATSPKAKHTGRISKGQVVVAVEDIRSERGETMNNKMYNALKKDEHPAISFALTSPIDIAASTQKVSVKGNVTLAGVTLPITFDLDVSKAEDGFRFRGKKSLKLSAFDITPPTAMFGQIETGDDILVELDLLFTTE